MEPVSDHPVAYHLSRTTRRVPVLLFFKEFKNWKYKMQVGTTINLCDQRPADRKSDLFACSEAYGKLVLSSNANSSLFISF